MDVKRFEILPVLESVRLNEKINFQVGEGGVLPVDI